MNAKDLDIAYSEFCQTMSVVGEAGAELFLARFALLSIIACGDLEKIRQLIADAAAVDAPTAMASRTP